MNQQKKAKVSFIHPDLGIGGAERLVLDVAVALANNGHEAMFVTNHFDKLHAFEELKSDKYPVYVIGNWIPRSACGICQALCAYLRMLYLTLVYLFFTNKEREPDIYFVDQIPMAVPFIKWSGNKVVYYCHHPDLLASPPGGILKKLYRLPIDWIEYYGTSYADVILVNSRYTATVFHKTFPEIKNDIKILYPTISSSYQTKVENRQTKIINALLPDINVSNDTVTFLSINRFHPAKKLELALCALEAFKQKVSPDNWNRVHLIMAGGYDPHSAINARYFSKLIHIAGHKGIATKVTFLKSPSDDLKADLLLACDCLIYTPVNEHFGIVPLEAMIAGKPVLACNSGGPCETVEHGVTGYLCEPTGESLADFMVKMFDKNNCKKMGSLGKVRQEKYFSHVTFTSSINKVIEDMIGLCNTNDQAEVIQAQNVANEAFEVEEGTPDAQSIENLSHSASEDSNVTSKIDIADTNKSLAPDSVDQRVESKITEKDEAIKTELERGDSVNSCISTASSYSSPIED